MTRSRLIISLFLACLAVLLPAAAAAAATKAPAGFFGIAPQTGLTDEDARYMKAGGIGTVRLSLPWAGVQPTANGEYQWGGFDQAVGIAARAGLQILPSLGSPPRWVTRKETTMPIDSARQRTAWTRFLRAAVARYGPGGDFWREHRQEVDGEPAIPRPQPIRNWQIWNEANFFYFAFPVSPTRYAKLVTISSRAVKSVRPGAKVILAGLFGEPTAGGNRGMPAAKFLDRLYRVRGFERHFDGVALHPYAVSSRALERIVEDFHDVTVKNHDRPGLYITEIGWGSQNNFKQVAFEQGIRGQVRQLRGSYKYLLTNRRRLNLKQVHWFSWKDLEGLCSFCDSVGFFREGPGFKAKPAWHAFVAITGGRARP